uniref:Uncharacterized protein n=1 Tax=viral metagenome TaxID=1070528 RepID=A0A6H2A6G4_9ZZZZ
MEIRKLEDFGDFEQWERISDDGLTTAKVAVEKGSSVENAFEAQDSGWRGNVWRDDIDYY